MNLKGLTNLDKLYLWISKNNKARLQYIQPRDVANEIDVTEDEADALLSSLVDKGQATRYFIFKCPGEYCQEEIVIDDDIIEDKTECEICNKTFLPKESGNNLKYIAYEIYKEKNSSNIGEMDYKSKYFGKTGCAKVDEIDRKLQVIGSTGAEVIPFNKENNYKIFISHNEKDCDLANVIIDLLEDLGIDSDGSEGKIFCSSALGRGVPIGDDIFKVIKDKFDENIIVLFLFTPNFYKSPACMCEMGATWVKVKEFVPLLTESMKFSDIKGIINTNIKGFDLSNYSKFAEFTQYFISKFELEEPNINRYEKIKEKYRKGIEGYKK